MLDDLRRDDIGIRNTLEGFSYITFVGVFDGCMKIARGRTMSTAKNSYMINLMMIAMGQYQTLKGQNISRLHLKGWASEEIAVIAKVVQTNFMAMAI